MENQIDMTWGYIAIQKDNYKYYGPRVYSACSGYLRNPSKGTLASLLVYKNVRNSI